MLRTEPGSAQCKAKMPSPMYYHPIFILFLNVEVTLLFPLLKLKTGCLVPFAVTLLKALGGAL